MSPPQQADEPRPQQQQQHRFPWSRMYWSGGLDGQPSTVPKYAASVMELCKYITGSHACFTQDMLAGKIRSENDVKAWIKMFQSCSPIFAHDSSGEVCVDDDWRDGASLMGLSDEIINSLDSCEEGYEINMPTIGLDCIQDLHFIIKVECREPGPTLEECLEAMVVSGIIDRDRADRIAGCQKKKRAPTGRDSKGAGKRRRRGDDDDEDEDDDDDQEEEEEDDDDGPVTHEGILDEYGFLSVTCEYWCTCREQEPVAGQK